MDIDWCQDEISVLRELDTITEVSETSSNSALRDYSGHVFSLPYSPQDNDSLYGSREKTRVNNSIISDSGIKSGSKPPDPSDRFLLAYQKYFSSDTVDTDSTSFSSESLPDPSSDCVTSPDHDSAIENKIYYDSGVKGGEELAGTIMPLNLEESFYLNETVAQGSFDSNSSTTADNETKTVTHPSFSPSSLVASEQVNVQKGHHLDSSLLPSSTFKADSELGSRVTAIALPYIETATLEANLTNPTSSSSKRISSRSKIPKSLPSGRPDPRSNSLESTKERTCNLFAPDEFLKSINQSKPEINKKENIGDTTGPTFGKMESMKSTDSKINATKIGFLQQLIGTHKEKRHQSNFSSHQPNQKEADPSLINFDAIQLKKLISPAYFEAISLSQHQTAPSNESQFKNLNDSVSSTIMNETVLSVKSNDDSIGSRPSSDSSWPGGEYNSFRNEQKRRQMENDEENKQGRRNKYKSKIDRARQNYFQPPDHQKSSPDQSVGKTRPSAHLPESCSTPTPVGTTRQKIDPKSLAEFKLRPPNAKYDSEYESIVKTAEQSWSKYKRGTQSPKINNYFKSRALSTGVLETDVDTGQQKEIEPISVRETDLDQLASCGDRDSRKRNKENTPTVDRAKSADCAYNKKTKETLEPPENELSKTLYPNKEKKDLSIHEMRFKKSLDKLHVPDWYLKSEYFGRTRSPSPKNRKRFEGPLEIRKYENQNEKKSSTETGEIDNQKSPTIENRKEVGTVLQTILNGTPQKDGQLEFHLPKNFFEKYKDEIEELRKSRTYLKIVQHDSSGDHRRIVPVATVKPNQIRDEHQEKFSETSTSTRNQFATAQTPATARDGSQRVNGWTVSSLPNSQCKVAVETAVECDSNLHSVYHNTDQTTQSLGEILESIAIARTKRPNGVTVQSQPTKPVSTAHIGHFGIYAKNMARMEMCIGAPHLAPEILKSESLWFQCANCHQECQIPNQRLVSCNHCYQYYCGDHCRLSDQRHNSLCDYARVNALCQKIILNSRRDPEAIYRMASLSRTNFPTNGRGFIDFRFPDVETAISYLEIGWRALGGPNDRAISYLNYVPIGKLTDQKSELCRSYDPKSKFILNVAVIVDLKTQESINRQKIDSSQVSAPLDALPTASRVRAVAPSPPKSAPKRTSSVVKSVLKSVENIASRGIAKAPYSKPGLPQHESNSNQKNGRIGVHWHLNNDHISEKWTGEETQV